MSSQYLYIILTLKQYCTIFTTSISLNVIVNATGEYKQSFIYICVPVETLRWIGWKRHVLDQMSNFDHFEENHQQVAVQNVV